MPVLLQVHSALSARAPALITALPRGEPAAGGAGERVGLEGHQGNRILMHLRAQQRRLERCAKQGGVAQGGSQDGQIAIRATGHTVIPSCGHTPCTALSPATEGCVPH
jgi:hypothetical protein